MGLKRFAKNKEKLDSGFSSNTANEGDRLLNKDGSYNVQKQGLNFFQRFSLFHALINMSWATFFLWLFTAYIIINLLFASSYMLIGTYRINGADGITSLDQFLDAFFFSSQTLTTVGYGSLSPIGTLCSLIASIESFVGLLSFAMATGTLYGRFSKPRAKITYSDNALISPYKEIKGVMIRIANLRDSQLINMKAKMLYSQIENENNGPSKRKFYTLDLEIDNITLLALSWTIVHPIDENSPLFGLSKDDLIKRNIEIVMILEGHDETYSQEVHTRTSYKANELIEDAKFISAIGQNKEGKATLSMDSISLYEKVYLNNTGTTEAN